MPVTAQYNGRKSRFNDIFEDPIAYIQAIVHAAETVEKVPADGILVDVDVKYSEEVCKRFIYSLIVIYIAAANNFLFAANNFFSWDILILCLKNSI